MCKITSLDDAVSVEISSGLRNGTYNPNFSTVSFICFESVLTIISLSSNNPRAQSIVYWMRGFPCANFTFFPGSLLEPPLAGMITKFFSCLFLI